MRHLLATTMVAGLGCAGTDKGECDADLVALDSVTASIDPTVSTFAEVSLSLDAPADVTVVARAEGAPDVAGLARSGLEGAVTIPLRGLRPDTSYDVTVRADGDDGCEEAVVPLETGSLLPDTPTFDVVEDDGSQNGYVMAVTAATGDGAAAIAVLDSGGVPVWSWMVDPREGNLQFAELAPDGETFLVVLAGREPEDGRVVRVDWTGSIVSDMPVPGAHHSATQEVPGLDFAVLINETRDVPGYGALCGVEGDRVIGDAIVEVGLDGTQTEVWNAFEDRELDCHFALGFLGSDGLDWTHANAIDYDAGRDAWLLSFYWLAELRIIDRASRETLTRIGDVAEADCPSDFSRQHAAEFTESGVALFDNGADPAARMLELELEPCGVRTEVPDPADHRAATLGDIDVLDDRWVTAWGDDGSFMTVKDERVTWRVAATEAYEEDHGGVIAVSTDWFPDLYPGE